MDDFPINPGDVRFFGNPIDYIAFTDMGSKKKCAIHFVEVKSGKSNLNNRQKNIKNAILEGKVHWHEYNVDGIWEHESKTQHLNKEKNG
jgi:predicted Holliday junction resolvase-like endonuclease